MTDSKTAQVVQARRRVFPSCGDAYQYLHHSVFSCRDRIRLHTPAGFLETFPCSVRQQDQDGTALLTAGKQYECLPHLLTDPLLRSYSNHPDSHTPPYV